MYALKLTDPGSKFPMHTEYVKFGLGFLCNEQIIAVIYSTLIEWITFNCVYHAFM